MKKKIFFMSVMLMGCLSFFTSCVDGDYYDLYDDEGEYFSPRNKKGKESFGGTIYPYEFLNQSTFLVGECAATCYKNMNGCTVAQARSAIIEQQFGNVDEGTIMQYYYSVRSIQDTTPTGDMLDLALQKEGWEHGTPSDLYDHIRQYNSYPEKVAIKVEGHVGVIDSLGCDMDATHIVYNIKIKDQYPSGDKRPKDKQEIYHIVVDRATGNYIGSDIHAIWW